MTHQNKVLLVIGGGAAGFFCAINAKLTNPSLKVIIIEKSNKLLSKVKISGGGRCNVTHQCSSIAEMVKAYPRGDQFLKKAFYKFFTSDTINWFELRGVKLKAEADGRMFPVTDNSQTIIDCFMHEVNKLDIDLMMNKEVKKITEENNLLNVLLSNGDLITCDFLCIASGGFPKISQFDWLKSLGHNIIDPVPSLFTFNIKEDPIKELMGISVPQGQVKILGTKFNYQGPILITHWGFSGPCVLKLSSFAARALSEKNYSFTILINWIGGVTEQDTLEKFRALRFELASQKFINRNPFGLPSRLWEYLMNKAGINAETRWADLPAKQQNLFVKNLCAQEFQVSGKTTFKEEFVTSGGIDTAEIDVNTMESRKVKNVFFAGEVINIDGITGGYNFQNAWTTGFIAAKAIAAKALESNS
ncbi:MAG: NAD(P)/FAD-dependent oxidoreductase [Ginsengibacter sp.]